MEKEFVPYEFAFKLKALGFNQPCFGWYEHNSNFYYCYQEGLVPPSPSKKLIKGCCLAPTFSQAFRWFREEYKLHTEIRSFTAKYFTIIIQECKDIVRYIEYGGIDLKFNTYEEAEVACLTKLIEIVENR